MPMPSASRNCAPATWTRTSQMSAGVTRPSLLTSPHGLGDGALEQVPAGISHAVSARLNAFWLHIALFGAKVVLSHSRSSFPPGEVTMSVHADKSFVHW